MSLVLTTADGGQTPYDDGENGQYAYQVTAAGGLAVLHKTEKQDDKWYLRFEYSPAGWLSVEGTRYLFPLDRLAGADGVVKRKPGPAPTVTIL